MGAPHQHVLSVRVMIPTEQPHPDWIQPESRRSRWWLWLFVPPAPFAAWILPTYVVVALIVFILLVIRYSDRG